MNASWSVCLECQTLVAEEGGHGAWHAALASRLGGIEGTAVGPSWAGDPVPVIPPMSEQERAEQDVQSAAVHALTIASASAHTDGAPWVRPTGAHDAYRKGITATHAGKTWDSLLAFNVWEPGVSGWRELVLEGYPDWVQPTGAHDAYQIGDRVHFESADYESTIDGNVWSPTAHPAGWRRL